MQLVPHGSVFNAAGLYAFDFDLPEGAQVVGDKAYKNYAIEDMLDVAGIKPGPFQKEIPGGRFLFGSIASSPTIAK